MIANDRSFEYVGIHLMLAGLALQVFSLAVVLGLAADFAWRCRRKGGSWDESYKVIRGRKYFKGFLYGEFASYPRFLDILLIGRTGEQEFLLQPLLSSSARASEFLS